MNNIKTRSRIWLVGWGIVVTMLGASIPVAATGLNDADPMFDGEPTTAAGGADAYSPDPSFHGGTWIVDDFAGNLTQPNAGFRGEEIARLPNGDYVVAALVKKPDGSQSSSSWNLGLVHYNRRGTQRLTWSAPTAAHAHYHNQYVVYPNTTSPAITAIKDMIVVNNRILVLVEMLRASYYETVVLVFGTDGSYKSQTSPFFFNPGPGIGDTNDHPGGIAARVDLVSGRYFVMVAGTLFRPATGHGRGVFRRYELTDNGLVAQTPMIDLNTSACWSTTWECHVRDLVVRSLYDQHAYVLYAMRPNTGTQNWNVVVSRINFDGQGDPSWDPNNVSWNLSDGGNGADWPVGMLVRTPPSAGVFRDQIYVVTESSRACQPGTGVLRFNHDGGLMSSRLIGGATDATAVCNLNSRDYDKPQGIAGNVTNGHDGQSRIAVVGHRGTSYVNDGRPRALFMVFDAGLGLLDQQELRYPLDVVGDGTRYPAFGGVVGDANGFTMTGNLMYPTVAPTAANLRGKRSTAALRMTTGVIFANGFD